MNPTRRAEWLAAFCAAIPAVSRQATRIVGDTHIDCVMFDEKAAAQIADSALAAADQRFPEAIPVISRREWPAPGSPLPDGVGESVVNLMSAFACVPFAKGVVAEPPKAKLPEPDEMGKYLIGQYVIRKYTFEPELWVACDGFSSADVIWNSNGTVKTFPTPQAALDALVAEGLVKP